MPETHTVERWPKIIRKNDIVTVNAEDFAVYSHGLSYYATHVAYGISGLTDNHREASDVWNSLYIGYSCTFRNFKAGDYKGVTRVVRFMLSYYQLEALGGIPYVKPPRKRRT